MYNLFSNIIETHSLEQIRKFIPHFNRGAILTYLKQHVDLLLETEDVEVFMSLSKDVFQICNSLRTSNLSLAHEIYMSFLYELTTRNLYQDYKNHERKAAFLDDLNFTEIYYNIAKLKWDSGDYDNALYYIIHADLQNSKRKDEQSGMFVKFLLNSQGYVLWNVIPYLEGDFSNYKSYFNISQIEDILGRVINKEYIKELLNDFDILLLLQFINSVNRYHNFMGEKPNEYRTLREFKILGELSLLFECYLKSKLSISNIQLYNVIDTYLFANSKELLTQFKYYDNLDLPVKDKKSKEYYEQSLEFMFNEFQTNTDSLEVAAICIRITYLFRNYSSHNIDDKFFKDNKDNRSIHIYLAIISSFLIAFECIRTKDK
jgi:hypothetical protein